MTLHYKIKIRDSTTPDMLDSFFEHAWTHGRPVKFMIDVTGCRNVSLGRILSMKGVLDKHRQNSRRYIEHSEVMVKSRFVKTLLNIGLSIIKTERPVYIKLAK